MVELRLNRRKLLAAAAGSAAAAASSSPVTARTISGEMPWAPGQADNPEVVTAGPYQFFQSDEIEFITAAVARLIPHDETGPGAVEAGVVTFLDRQLAGDYGGAGRWYMLGPWRSGTASQGYQTRLTPAQLYRAAIKAIDAYLQSSDLKKRFSELTAEQQDQVLTRLENDELRLPNVNGRAFFELLLENTIEGYFCDPIHGGNRDMAAWRMIGFPGARYDYRDYVAKHGERITLSPVSIAGRSGWNPKS